MNIQVILNVAALVLSLIAAYKSSRLTIALPLLGAAGIMLVISFLFKGQSRYKKSFIATVSVFLLLAAINVFFIRSNIFYRYDPDSINVKDFAPQINDAIPDNGIDIITFYTSEKKAKSLKSLLSVISPKIRYNNYDPDISPLMAQKYGDVQYDSVTICYRSRCKKFDKFSIQKLASAISFVLDEYQKNTICFISGHNESNPYMNNSDGFTELTQLFDDNGLKWKEINLIRETSDNTENCNAFILTLNGTPLFEEEKKIIKKLFGNQSNFMILLGSATFKENLNNWVGEILPLEISGKRLIPAHNLLIQISKDVVICDNSNTPDNLPIQPLALYKPFVLISLQDKQWTSTDLVEASGGNAVILGEESIGKSNISYPVALSFINKNQQKAIVVGDTEWITNQNINRSGNKIFALKSALWLLNNDENTSAFKLANFSAKESQLLDMTDDQIVRFKQIYLFVVPSTIFGILFILWRKI